MSELEGIFEDKKIINENFSSHQSEKKQFCNTCMQEIGSDISRVLIMRDRDNGPRLLCFHFFFPCWDFKELCKKYPNLIIDSVGFSIPENIHLKEKSKEDLEKNLEFWN